MVKKTLFGISFFASLVIHLAVWWVVARIPPKPVYQPVRIVVESAPPKLPEPVVAPVTKTPEAPQKKIPRAERRQTSKSTEKPPTPVQGVTDAQGTLAAPMGNTLMRPDEGKRLRPEEVAALAENLSADPQIIDGTYRPPQYTDAAVSANLVGRFVVEVFVDAEGKVLEVELQKRVGYGMDERLLKVAETVRFVPRKNARGEAVPGWTAITFILERPE